MRTSSRLGAAGRASRRGRQRGPILLLIATWLLVGMIALGQVYANAFRAGEDLPFHLALSIALPAYVLWALLSPLVIHLGRRFSLVRPFQLRRVLALAGSLVAISIGHLAFLSVYVRQLTLARGYEVATQLSVFQTLFLERFHLNVLIVGAILGVGYAFRNHERYLDRDLEASRLQARAAELQVELARARLDALTRQLQPHFLFNTLNSISALMTVDATAAREMIARLSDLLRLTLETAEEPEVPLTLELQILDRYLAIQQIRFQESLLVRVEAREGIGDAIVPLFILQPLVENALKHAPAANGVATEIVVSARRDDGLLVMEVRDNGPGLDPSVFRKGIGISNTELRLEQLYGDQASLEMTRAPEGGVNAKVVLPYHTSRDTFEGVTS